MIEGRITPQAQTFIDRQNRFGSMPTGDGAERDFIHPWPL